MSKLDGDNEEDSYSHKADNLHGYITSISKLHQGCHCPVTQRFLFFDRSVLHLLDCVVKGIVKIAWCICHIALKLFKNCSIGCLVFHVCWAGFKLHLLDLLLCNGGIY